jgi:hypothetical protein
MISLSLANELQLAWAQEMVTKHHYLHAPVDNRCSVEAYLMHWFPEDPPMGCLIFGRPQATQVRGWYGSLEDVGQGKCELSYWSILNLARVWISPEFQPGGEYHGPEWMLPGFTDRKGTWRSTWASEVIREAVQSIGYDYLCQRPPVFPEQPYQIRWLLSYCNPAIHRGIIYKAAGWELYRTNEEGLQTWRFPLPPLTPEQDARIRRLAEQHPRSRRHRSQRAAAAQATQLAMEVL